MNQIELQNKILIDIRTLKMGGLNFCKTCVEKNFCQTCKLNYMIKDLIRFGEKY